MIFWNYWGKRDVGFDSFDSTNLYVKKNKLYFLRQFTNHVRKIIFSNFQKRHKHRVKIYKIMSPLFPIHCWRNRSDHHYQENLIIGTRKINHWWVSAVVCSTPNVLIHKLWVELNSPNYPPGKRAIITARLLPGRPLLARFQQIPYGDLILFRSSLIFW